MQFTAKLIQALPVETGMGKNGEWKKQNVIVETDGQYPKKICLTAWGDTFNPAQTQPGTMLTIDFDLESREFNGRWYTDVKAWRIEAAGTPQSPAPMSDPPANFNLPEPPPQMPAPGFNDLPF